MIAAVVAGVLLAGVLIGYGTHKLYRFWADEEAAANRRRFHALFADPTADIEDLVAMEATVRVGLLV